MWLYPAEVGGKLEESHRNERTQCGEAAIRGFYAKHILIGKAFPQSSLKNQNNLSGISEIIKW